MARERHRRTLVGELLQEFEKTEPDFAYWIELVVHWHALLFAVVTVLSIGYLLFSKQHAMAALLP